MCSPVAAFEQSFLVTLQALQINHAVEYFSSPEYIG